MSQGSRKTHIARIHPDAKMPSYGTKMSSGIDLYLCEDIAIPPGKVGLARTGIVVKPPLGYFYELCLRSSTPIKNPGIVLANGIGIIDADYCGTEDEIRIPLLNTCDIFSEGTIIFRSGDRIAQLVLREVRQPELEEVSVEKLRVNSRGGFGSTGEK